MRECGVATTNNEQQKIGSTAGGDNDRFGRKNPSNKTTFHAGDASGPNRVVMQWYGDADPIASNDTREGRALNRRVEMAIGGLR